MEIKVFTQFAHNLHICLSMCKMYSTYYHGLTVFGVNKSTGVILFEFLLLDLEMTFGKLLYCKSLMDIILLFLSLRCVKCLYIVFLSFIWSRMPCKNVNMTCNFIIAKLILCLSTLTVWWTGKTLFHIFQRCNDNH